MLTDIEVRNKLFFKSLSRFIVEDPLGASAPLYDDDGSDVIIGHLNKPPEIIRTGTHKRINVPLYEFESKKQYIDMFIEVVKKAVEITGYIHECDELKESFFNSIMIGGYCSAIMAPHNRETTLLQHQLNKENSHIRLVTQNYEDEPGMIYCFPEPEYTGVCPERQDWLGPIKKSDKIELGLMLIANSVHAIKMP